MPARQAPCKRCRLDLVHTTEHHIGEIDMGMPTPRPNRPAARRTGEAEGPRRETDSGPERHGEHGRNGVTAA
ncbi:hypothetical protein Hesp01_09680 [Herbidospora sp. NBRC 101105]|nr:hypothetical protein Hesp01_09680 [Herbidospora sp. NBRC 101105]